MLNLVSLRALLHRHGLAALSFAGAASTGFSPSADGDVWWHLAAGRAMVAQRSLLFTDPFSVSSHGRPWTDVHWLFQLLLYGTHRLAGLGGLVLLKCALLGSGALLLVSSARPRRWAAPALVTWLMLALFVARSLLLVRPVLVTLVCLALFWQQLERYRVDGKARRLALLVGMQVIWANCQGLSALGPAVMAAYLPGAWLGRRGARALAVAELGCVLASLLTPFGWQGLSLSRALFERLLPGAHNVYAHTIAENVPPFLLERWTGGELWHFKWYCLCLAAALVLGRRPVQLCHALLLGGFGALALLSNRNVLLFYWISSPIAALHLAPALRAVSCRLGHARARWLPLLNAAALCAILGVSVSAAAHETSIAQPSPFRVPGDSAERLAQLPPGDVFCADHHGGYLIWRLFPRQRPYMDTRLVLRTADEYADYLALAEIPQRFEAFQARHHFGYVLLPVDYPDRYRGLIAELYRSHEFRLIFTNGSEVLFARRDLVTAPAVDLGDAERVAALEQSIDARFGGRAKLLEAARLQLATLEITVGELERAEQVLQDVTSPAGTTLLARVAYLKGDPNGAEALARRQLRRDPGHAASLTLLSRIALDRGQLPLGARLLRRALQTDPFDAEATQLLSSLEARQP